ncbi:hypothetical protein KP509_20G034000 [Ceratopteris richardii]|uniref:EF-hand domain-containing protein n=1 Tax=Ceratopteris richardii TaxID=49495 RepID=A0A8T2SI74_CERRI|nr:hypothetical protein KP509_20G034000 [Ceratopteris richardii]
MAGSAIINNEQYVDKREFSQFYSTTHGDEDLVDAFNVFDKDRNGLISANELRSVLISLGFSQEACAIEACTAMIARVDKNGDAHVDLCEFTSLLRLECHHDSCGILAL